MCVEMMKNIIRGNYNIPWQMEPAMGNVIIHHITILKAPMLSDYYFLEMLVDQETF